MKHTKDKLSKLRTTMFYQVKEKLRTNFEEVNFGEEALNGDSSFPKINAVIFPRFQA